MSAPLVLLAAGLGSRFGGIKPLAPVGPGGEAILLVSLQQAADAGFERAVVVVGAATEAPVRDALAIAPIPCRFVRQRVPAGRTKPLGTVDAVLSGSDGELDGVVVANGDDLYGAVGLRAARAWMARQHVDVRHGAAVLYRLASTVPVGSVDGFSRAVAVLDIEQRMTAIEEHRDVRRLGAGYVDGSGHVQRADDLVSMNLWCFSSAGLRMLRDAHHQRAYGIADEFGLPDAIRVLIDPRRSQRIVVDTMVTDSPWHGVTWASDVDVVRAALLAERERSEGP